MTRKVGYMAVNDGILVESLIYKVLKKHLGPDFYKKTNDNSTTSSTTDSFFTAANGFDKARKMGIYTQVLDLFHETFLDTELGQLMDTRCENIPTLDELASVSRWTHVVTFKTAFYSFYHPVASAMILCGVDDERSYDFVREACVKLGQYFQAQDDVLDCFADQETLGKIGTDIADRKCSWLFVQSWSRLNAEQKLAFEKFYGKCELSFFL